MIVRPRGRLLPSTAVESSLRLKLGRRMVPIPRAIWRWQVRRAAAAIPGELAFMSDDHHRVRNFAVRELPELGAAMEPDLIAERLALPPARVDAILGELERHKTFLYRTDGRRVDWAYPVTVDDTPHHLSFESGERMTAA